MSGSMVVFAEDKEGNPCPYCKAKDTCFSNWIWTFSLTPEELECLINRGFSRLGMWCMKPTKPTTSCCPEFGIRCSALEFKLSKSQKKVLRKFNGFLRPSLKEGQGHPKTKQLEDYMNEIDKKYPDKRNFEVKLVKTNSEEFLDSFPRVFELYKKYQIAIHKETEAEVTEERFKWNFCDSPINEENANDRDICGSYHQHYYVDDKLIAVGAIDILPTMLCSNYFFYDPEFRALSLGTFGALQEITFLRKLNKEHRNLQFYSMGSFVPSSSKIRYKTDYSPSYLQCPETFSWVYFNDKVRKTVEARNVTRLAMVPAPSAGTLGDKKSLTSATADPNKIQIWYEGENLTYKSYIKQRSRNGGRGGSGCLAIFSRGIPCLSSQTNKEKAEIKQYCKLVGPTLVERLILVRGAT